LKTMRTLYGVLFLFTIATVVACSSGSQSVVPTAAGLSPASDTVAPTPGVRGEDATGVLKDGGFENGYTYWSQCGSGASASEQTGVIHSGTHAAKFGGTTTVPNGSASLCQSFAVPVSAGTVTFWIQESTNQTSTTNDYQAAELTAADGTVRKTLFKEAHTTSGWEQRTYDVSSLAGQTVVLKFLVQGNGASGANMVMYIDDITVGGGSATPTPGPTPIATPSGHGSQSCGTTCGVERWHIKTLDDAYWNTVNWTPSLVSVSTLAAAPVPTGFSSGNDTTRYAPYETQSYTVRAVLVGWKKETDQDFHIVIADPNAPSTTMIIEPPDPTCSMACASGFQNYYTSVRAKLVACFGNPPSAFTNFASGIVVDVTGVAYFDPLHGQTGVAPNGIELHPLLSLSWVSGQPGGCVN